MEFISQKTKKTFSNKLICESYLSSVFLKWDIISSVIRDLSLQTRLELIIAFY